MKLHARFSILTALVLGTAHLASAAQTEIFDWNNITYAPTPAQATAGTTLTDTAITDNTLSLQYALNGGATFSTVVQSPASASNSASTNVYATSGNAAQNSLQTVVDFASSAQSTTITLTFSQFVANASFKLFDVDAGSVNGGGYLDVISSIQGVTFQGAPAYAATVTGSADNVVSGTGSTFQISGTGNNPQTSSLGDATITFGSIPLKSISFVYGDNYTAGTHSAIQITALGNITVTTVPEPGTLALVGLGIAGAATVASRRCQ